MPTGKYKSICAAPAAEMLPVGTVTGATSETITCADLASFKKRLKTYLFRRCYETVWLWIAFPFLVSESVVLAMVFYCLGHYKNVYDDDNDDDDSDDDDDDDDGGDGDDGGDDDGDDDDGDDDDGGDGGDGDGDGDGGDGDDDDDDGDDGGDGDDGDDGDDDTCKKTSRESGRPTMLCR